MRLIGTLQDDRLAKGFSHLLNEKKIENLVEITKNTDWSSPNYGTLDCRVWIYDEDRLEESLQLFERFKENPVEVVEKEEKVQENTFPHRPKKPSVSPVRPKGVITLYFLTACALIFFANLLTMPPIKSVPKNVPEIPFFHSPVSKILWFDYPKSWELIDQLEQAYGNERLESPNDLPKEGQALLKQANALPVFDGFYPKIVSFFSKNEPITIQATLFEKIREGEIWRLFTPCLLHFDIIHLFFNMIWLFVLGVQMEGRLPKGRYVTFIIFTGIFSNVCQYLMGGPNFIGFSGVLCAMIMYVWIRQKKAPWEGYQLLPITMGFITVFIVAMFAVQTLSFLLEISGKEAIPIAIANTAHLSGALAGFFLAQFKFFSWKR
jgi:GlpG protein